MFLCLIALFVLTPSAAYSLDFSLKLKDAGTELHKPAMSSAPAAVQPYKNFVDLKSQFPNQNPDQGNVGACHTFAGIGLVEAAYYRKYGEHLDFAEQDMFARSALGGATVCNGARVYGVGKSTGVAVAEGGIPANNAMNAIMGGIVPDSREYCASYDDFAREFSKFTKKLEHAMKLRGSPIPFVMPGKLDKHM